MTRTRVLWATGALVLVLLAAAVMRWTRWEQVSVPLPMTGEARTNPVYGAQRFAEALGARTLRVQGSLQLPPPSGVVVLSGWNWDLSRERRQSLERWVESGGRLVVDGMLIDPNDAFETWSAIRRRFHEPDEADADSDQADEQLENQVEQDSCVVHQAAGEASRWGGPYELCDFQSWSYLEARGAPEWTLSTRDSGSQVLRVRMRAGSVTVVNATPFRNRALLDGDHGRLFVAATQLRSGDEVYFLSEGDYPALPVLIWRQAGPAVVVGLLLVGVLLWRQATRLGPLAPQADVARRSLADQIRGATRFARRHGDGDVLHAAALRALDDAARRRIPGFARLSSEQRAGAVAKHSGLPESEVTAAMAHVTSRAEGLGARLAIIESARRRLLDVSMRHTHVAE